MTQPVLVVGAGRVGRAIALGLGLPAPLCGRADGTQLEAALSGLAAGALERGAPRVMLIAVRDDALWGLVARAAELEARAGRRGGVVLHTSGALAADRNGPLSPLCALGWSPGGLHPLRAVRGAGEQQELRGAPAGISGEGPARDAALQIARALAMEPFELPPGERQRLLYHCGAALLAGGAVALVDAALAAFAAAGLERGAGRVALASLLRSVAENLSDAAPAEVATGPVARGDSGLLRAQLAALGAAGLVDEAELHRRLSLRLLALVRGSLSAEDVAALAEVLGSLPGTAGTDIPPAR